MKIITSILALLVFFLSTQCISVRDCAEKEKAVSEKKCCTHKKTCKKDKESTKDEGCNNACNPFMFCSGCLYVFTGKTIFSFETIKDIPVRTGFKQAFLDSDYNADCWHPPEIV